MVRVHGASHLGRVVVCTIVAFFATSLDGAEKNSAQKSAAEKEKGAECHFVLPAIEQNKEYIAQLANLTLFKDCRTEGSYLYYHRWYVDELPSRRYWSRGLAIAIIVLGAILPLVVIWQKTERHYKLAVALIGALIVIAQGLSQTFAYDTAWRNFMLARMKLEAAQDAWQHEMIKASLASTTDSLTRMEAATDTFGKQVSDAVLEETTGFFTAVQEAAKARNAEKPVSAK